MRLRYLLAFLPAVCFGQSAQINYNLPQSQGFAQGTDRYRSSDGSECSHSTAPRRAYLEVGGFGGGTSGMGSDQNNMGSVVVTGTGSVAQSDPTPFYKNVGGGYAKLTINLDTERPQLDCSKLYEMDLEQKRLELEQARMMRASPKQRNANP